VHCLWYRQVEPLNFLLYYWPKMSQYEQNSSTHTSQLHFDKCDVLTSRHYAAREWRRLLTAIRCLGGAVTSSHFFYSVAFAVELFPWKWVFMLYSWYWPPPSPFLVITTASCTCNFSEKKSSTSSSYTVRYEPPLTQQPPRQPLYFSFCHTLHL